MGEERVKVYEYVVVFRPDEDGDEEERGPEIVLGPKVILAKSEKEVVMRVSREVPEKWADDLADLDVTIRPF